MGIHVGEEPVYNYLNLEPVSHIGYNVLLRCFSYIWNFLELELPCKGKVFTQNFTRSYSPFWNIKSLRATLVMAFELPKQISDFKLESMCVAVTCKYM